MRTRVRGAPLGHCDLVGTYALTVVARIAVASGAITMRFAIAMITGVVAMRTVMVSSRVAVLMFAVTMRIFVRMRAPSVMRRFGYRLRVRCAFMGVGA